MNTTTDRHSRSYHKRMLNTADFSAMHAEKLFTVLQAAHNTDAALSDNPYFMDALQAARNLYDEMDADRDYRIEAAIEDGFGPEDFE
jgi:hypothetical protein